MKKPALLKIQSWYWYCPSDWCPGKNKEQHADDNNMKYNAVETVMQVECEYCGHDYDCKFQTEPETYISEDILGEIPEADIPL